jgi:hypothetical protein
MRGAHQRQRRRSTRAAVAAAGGGGCWRWLLAAVAAAGGGGCWRWLLAAVAAGRSKDLPGLGFERMEKRKGCGPGFSTLTRCSMEVQERSWLD